MVTGEIVGVWINAKLWVSGSMPWMVTGEIVGVWINAKLWVSGSMPVDGDGRNCGCLDQCLWMVTGEIVGVWINALARVISRHPHRL
jgi:hypothetical protein